jgi:uncharacterized membrane protein
MDSRTIAYALYTWVVVAVATGSTLIIFGNTLMATVGAVVIIVGLASLMPAFSYLWWEDGSDVAVESADLGEAVESVDATETTEDQ